MGHTPYGYRIENGIAVIDEAAAAQVQELYKNYLSGLSLVNAAKEAGLTMRLPTGFSSSANSARSVQLTQLPEMHRLKESTTCRISSKSSVPTLLNSMNPW